MHKARMEDGMDILGAQSGTGCSGENHALAVLACGQAWPVPGWGFFKANGASGQRAMPERVGPGHGLCGCGSVEHNLDHSEKVKCAFVSVSLLDGRVPRSGRMSQIEMDPFSICGFSNDEGWPTMSCC